MLIDGAVGVSIDGAPEEEGLVDVPAAAKRTMMSPGRRRELWTEGLVQVSTVRAETNATLTEERRDLPGGVGSSGTNAPR